MNKYLLIGFDDVRERRHNEEFEAENDEKAVQTAQMRAKHLINPELFRVEKVPMDSE